MRSRKLAILLPPSEGKASGGGGPAWQKGTMSFAGLDDRRAAVLAALGSNDVLRGPTMPAGCRYTGVLYRELGIAMQPAVSRRRFDTQALVVSGLWGLVSPRDPIPDYRLKMSASLPGIGKLSTWWRAALTEALAERLEGRTVWDLLPIEHSAAWSPAEVPFTRRYTVRFVAASGATVSHWNKLGKGALTRALLEHQPADPAALGTGELAAGYRFDPASSELDRHGGTVVFRAAAG